jgi:hypothetical protein
MIMAANRTPKKSETIEIRLTHDMKQRFMTQCQDEGRAASEVLRDLIDTRCVPSKQGQRPRRQRSSLRLLTAGLVGGLLGVGLSVPSLAHDGPVGRAAFDRLDANHDGTLSFQEYRAR